MSKFKDFNQFVSIKKIFQKIVHFDRLTSQGNSFMAVVMNN